MIKGYIFRFLLISVAVLLQATLLSSLTIDAAKLDLVLILTIYFGFKGGIMAGQTTGFTGGLLEDLISQPTNFGINALIKTIIGFGIGNFHRRVYSESYLTIFLIVFICTLIKGVLLQTIFFFISQDQYTMNMALDYVFHTLLIELLYNAILAPFIFILLNKLNLNLESNT